MPLLAAENSECSVDGGEKADPWLPDNVGPFVRPGSYAVQLFSGGGEPLSGKAEFDVVALNENENIDPAFLARVQRANAEADRLAALFSNYLSANLSEKDRADEAVVKAHHAALFGDREAEHRSNPIISRLLWMQVNYWNSTEGPTAAHLNALTVIEERLLGMAPLAEKAAAALENGVQ